MALWSSINGELSGATNADTPKPASRLRALAAYLLVAISLIAESPTALSQSPAPETVQVTRLPVTAQLGPSPSPTPAKESDPVGQSAVSTSQTNDQSPESTKQQPDDQGKQKSEKRGSLVIAPIPISSPAFGSGLLLIVGYVFKFDKDDDVSPPSSVGAAGVFTSNGTGALALAGRLYLKENKYQTTFAVAKGHANLEFFGIGRIPGRSAIAVPLSMGGTIFFGEVMRNVGGNIFIGPRYQYRRLTAGLDGPPLLGGFEVPAIDLKSNSAALGFHLQRDRRNSTYYPTKGTLFDFTADFFDQIWGSRREYQVYKIAYNGFHEVAPRRVFAYRAMACSANGSVPFYDLCLYGFNSDVRGYTTGQFQNRRMFATQAEYRLDWRKRLGFVAFGGVGGVARDWNDFRMDGLLPGAGVGLRFKLDKKNHINYRIDFAYGREGHTLSIGLGEAF
ncbi:MAG: BamA/TamA family outer membrane protein [Pyrinomonadaceae bacterium]